MRGLYAFQACCAALVALAMGTADATTVKAFDTPSLVRASDLVVRARVGRSHSFWNTPRTRIYTESRLRPIDVLFDAVAARRAPTSQSGAITVRQLGGRIADTWMTVPGTAQFEEGDEVVVFLRRHDGFYTLVGMAQGCVVLRKTPTGLQAISDLHGATSIRQLVARSGHSESSGQSSAYWDDYEVRLKALIQQRLESEEGK